jgi:hypothetical protein
MKSAGNSHPSDEDLSPETPAGIRESGTCNRKAGTGNREKGSEVPERVHVRL